MAARGGESDAISGGRSPPSNQATNAGIASSGQNAASTSHQTISTQVHLKYKTHASTLPD